MSVHKLRHHVMGAMLSLFVLTGCAEPSEQPAVSPSEGLYIPMECLIEVDTWIDWNGNGKRDPDDGALEGVVFRMEWSKHGDGNYQVITWTSDATGHYETWLTSFGCLNFMIRAEAPPGYKLTTQDPYDFGFAPP